jgi:Na+/melibiose symporter-like transporter
MNETLTPQEKQQLKTIRLIFIAMAAFLCIMLLAAIIFVTVEGAVQPALNEYRTWLLVAAISITFICGWFGRRHFLKTIQAAKGSLDPLSVKLTKYQSSFIVYLASIELPVIFCIVLLLLTSDSFFQIFGAALLGSFLVKYPGEQKVLSQVI